MVKIYLVRHAQSTGNIEKRLTGREEYELTDEGKQQIEKMTEQLKNIKFSSAYSSPSKRAINTVKKLSEKNKLEIQIMPELSEMYFGIYDGWKWEDVNKINPSISIMHEKTNEIMQIPNQESTQQVADRMYKTIENIAIQNKDRNILIASHGVAIEAFLRKVTKVPFAIQREEYSQKNTSINIIEYNDKDSEFYIETLNSIEHLN